jgi:hypothetical protein
MNKIQTNTLHNTNEEGKETRILVISDNGVYRKRYVGNLDSGYEFTQEEIDKHYINGEEIDYVEARRLSYPDMKDQLDMMYWDRINDTTVWSDTIGNIKNQIPKN